MLGSKSQEVIGATLEKISRGMGYISKLEVTGPKEQCFRKLGEDRLGRETTRGQRDHRTCEKRLGQ